MQYIRWSFCHKVQFLALMAIDDQEMHLNPQFLTTVRRGGGFSVEFQCRTATHIWQACLMQDKYISHISAWTKNMVCTIKSNTGFNVFSKALLEDGFVIRYMFFICCVRSYFKVTILSVSFIHSSLNNFSNYRTFFCASLPLELDFTNYSQPVLIRSFHLIALFHQCIFKSWYIHTHLKHY